MSTIVEIEMRVLDGEGDVLIEESRRRTVVGRADSGAAESFAAVFAAHAEITDQTIAAFNAQAVQWMDVAKDQDRAG